MPLTSIGKVWPLLLVLGLLAGCSQAPGPTAHQPSAEGLNYLLDAEPAGAVGIEEALAMVGEGEEKEVAIVGLIPKEIGSGIAPWGSAGASFVVVDPAALADIEHAESPGHDADNCPFCKRRKAELPRALVQITNPRGEVLKQDVRTLLGLAENQIVVAQGRAKRDSLGNLTVSAVGVHVRQ